MASFIIDGPEGTARALLAGESGLIGPAGGLSVASGDAVSASGAGPVALSVLGYLRAEAQGAAALRGASAALELRLGAGATLSAAAPSGGAVDARLSDRLSVDNAGELSAAAGDAVRAIASDAGFAVRIDNSGRIAALDGLGLNIALGDGMVTLDNDGRISGAATAVLLAQAAGASRGASIWNDGVVSSSEGSAVRLVQAAGALNAVTNAGTLSAPAGFGLWADGGVVLWNGGLIQGGVEALRTGGGGFGDRVANDGTLEGGVRLSDGDNVLENFGTIRGAVTTEGGADRFLNALGAFVSGAGIALGAGADALTNLGTIAAPVRMGDGADTVTAGGTISGEVDMGGGADTLLVTGIASGIVRMGDGSDRVVVDGTATGAVLTEDGDDVLVVTGEATGRLYLGAGDDSVVVEGRALGDQILLGGGDDTIDARAGHVAGAIAGEAGRDVYLVSDPATRIVESTPIDPASPASEVDEVRSTIGFEIDDPDVELLTLVGSAPVDGVGNASANVLTGNGAANALAGLGGDDTLLGGLGADTLTGGAGADDLRGEGGADRLQGGDGADRLAGGAGDDWLLGEAGDDRIADAEGANRVEAGEGADFVDMGAALLGQWIALGGGDDMAVSGAGGDTVSGGTGHDRVSYLRSPVGVAVDLASGTALGGHAEGDVLDGVEAIEGSRHADTLAGDAGANALRAVGGGDRLMGRAGDDTLVAGDGQDVIDGGAGIDMASFESSPERVVVVLRTGFTAGGHAFRDTLVGIENLTGSVWNDQLTGDDGANLLRGGFGNDTIKGSKGDDTLEGGQGDDELKGGSGWDVFVFADLWGQDRVLDFEDGRDRIDMSGADGIGGLSNLRITTDGDDILIVPSAHGAADAIRLVGAAAGTTMTEADFLF